MTTLPPLMIYPATLPMVVLRNSTFRKRFLARRGGVDLPETFRRFLGSDLETTGA